MESQISHSFKMASQLPNNELEVLNNGFVRSTAVHQDSKSIPIFATIGRYPSQYGSIQNLSQSNRCIDIFASSFLSIKKT